MFLLVIAAFAIIGLLEIVPLVQAARIKELLLYGAVFSVAFLLSLLLSFNVKLPSPAGVLDQWVSAALKFFSS